MSKSRLTESELASALPLPKVGTVVNGKRVIDVKCMDAGGDFYTVGITFEKGTKQKDIPSMLKEILSAHHLTTKMGDFVIKSKDYQIRPKGGNVQVIIAMHIVPTILNNPKPKQKLSPLEDFDKHYNEMECADPGKYFRVFDYRDFNGPAFRAKLWSFVGYMGENYGYCDDKHIYHRRASLVMPKIKITQAVPKAKMMYHTHPRKDEPSFTSPDDFLLYFDLSMPPRGVRHFYTVMADRMDHFHIVPKKDAKGKYVRVDEDKFIAEVDAKIALLEEKHDAKFEKGDKVQDLKFCEAVTRDLVNWLNKKYGSYVTVKYKCYHRVRKNPEGPSFDDLHLGDEFIAKAIQDTRDGEYSWPTFDVDTKPHEKYAYWFIQYYFMEDDRDRQTQLLTSPEGRKTIEWGIKHRTKSLGLLPGRLRALNHYLDSIAHPEYSHYEILNLFALHYDIMANDSKVRDGGGMNARIEDMAKEMQLPDEVKDTLTMLHEAMTVGVYTPEAETLAGDFYPILVLGNLSIQAIQTMKSVESGTLTLEQAKHEVYHRQKSQAIAALDESLNKHQREYNRTTRHYKLNPAPKKARTQYEASIPEQYLRMSDIVIEALETYAPYEEGKNYLGGRGQLSLRIPGGGTTVTAMLFLRQGTIQLHVPARGHPIPEDSDKAAMEAYSSLVNRLNEYGLGIPTEELEVASMTVNNPRSAAQLIVIAGPSGSGKSTTIRNLLKALPKSKTVPTYTTRAKRRSDKASEKVFVTKEEFKRLDNTGEFAEVTLQKNGHYYGRRLDDFKDADYVIVDATLSGVNRLKQTFPGAYTVYIQPKEKPELIYQRMLRRGDMSPQEARYRSSIIPSHIQSSKKMSFDKRVTSQQGKFNQIAQQILDTVPAVNPPWKLEHQENPYIMLTEPWSDIKVPIDERLAPLVKHLWDKGVPTSYSDQGIGKRARYGYLVVRWPYDYAKPIIDGLVKQGVIRIDDEGVKLWKGGDRVFPENSITMRWKGIDALRKIYKAFGLEFPESRGVAAKMVGVKANPNWRHGNPMDESEDPFAEMFTEQ